MDLKHKVRQLARPLLAFGSSKPRSPEKEITGKKETDLDSVTVAVHVEEEKYRTTIAAIQDGVYVMRNDEVLFANEACEILVDRSLEEIRAAGWKCFLHPDDIDMVAKFATWRLASDDAVPARYECRIIRKDGEVRDVQIQARLAPNYPDGPAIIGTIKDVTDQKISEKSLQEEEEKYRTTIAAIQDGIYVLRNGEVLFVNAACEEIVDRSIEEIRAIGWQGFIHPDDLPEVTEHALHLLANKDSLPENYECRVVRPSGEIRYIQIQARMARNYPGAPAAIGTMKDITEQKIAEDTLRREEEKYRIALSAIQDAVFIRQGDKIVHANGAYERLVGRTIDDVNKIGWLATVHKEDRDRLIKICGDRMECGDERDAVEFRMVRPDGEIRVVLIQCNVAQNYPGGPATIATAKDITEQKQTHLALLESEQLLKHTLENVGGGVIIADEKGQIHGMNPAALEMFGYGAGELNGKNVTMLMPPSEAKRHRRGLKNYKRSEGPKLVRSSRKFTAITKAGEKFPIEIEIADFASNGKNMLVATVRDLSSQLRAEALDQRLGRILDASPNEIFVVDARTLKIVQVSQGARDNLGYEETSLVGIQFDDLLSSNDKNSLARLLKPLTVNGEDSLLVDVRMMRRNGSEYTAEAHIHYSRLDWPPVFVIIAVDLTEHLAAKEKAAETEAQLRRSQRLQTIGQLAGGIAHDFNNILTPILGYSVVLTEELPEGDPLHSDAKQIEQAARRGKDLVEQILAIGRPGGTNHEYVNLVEIVAEAAALQRSTLPPAISMELDLPDAPATIRGDASQIHQVVMNLFKNALQAMGKKQGELRISVTIQELSSDTAFTLGGVREGLHACLTIEDTGPGIEENVMEHLFDPFFTTKPVGEGTGLGLSVVHGIVQAHGGVVAVESETGRGAIFHVYFPSEHDSIVLPPQPSSRLIKGEARVLLVDDDPNVTNTLSRILTRSGFDVEVVHEPALATELITNNPSAYDLVVTDFVMPGQNGLELAAKIRRAAPSLPIILLTGHMDSAAVEIYNSSDISLLLTKPIHPAHFTASINRVLAGQVKNSAQGK